MIPICAFLVRVMPLQWGAYLAEFDPYYHYRVAKYVVENGFGEFFTWRDMQAWHPYGRPVAPTTSPGLPFTAAAIYLVLSFAGVPISLLDVCIFLPPVMGAITCLATYLLGKEIGGDEVGLLAALVMAFNIGYIERTFLGFFKHETIGVFSIVLTAFFFLRAINARRTFKSSITYAILSGLSLGYLIVSWGAGFYLFGLMSVFALALLLLGRYQIRLLTSFATMVALSLWIATLAPRTAGFPTGILALLAYAIITIFIMVEISRRTKGPTRAILVTSIAAGALIALAATGLFAPLMMPFGGLPGKIVGVLVPWVRPPIVESVAEHRMASWSALYYRFGPLLMLAVAGLITSLRRFRDTDIFIIVFALTSLAAGASYIRNVLIMSPAIAILSSIGVVALLKPLLQFARAPPPAKKSARILHAKVTKLGIATALLLFILVAMPIWEGVEAARFPADIARSSVGIRAYIPDWLEACAWLRDNTPEDSVVCSWWDYGYWITIVANRTSLADNSTINTTQIANIAKIFLSDEAEAIELLRLYDADYVLVFTTLPLRHFFFGEEAKWYWMAQIAGFDYDELVDRDLYEELSRDLGVYAYLPKRYTLLTKMMLHGSLGLEQYAPQNFTLAFRSQNGFVVIYEVPPI